MLKNQTTLSVLQPSAGASLSIRAEPAANGSRPQTLVEVGETSAVDEAFDSEAGRAALDESIRKAASLLDANSYRIVLSVLCRDLADDRAHMAAGLSSEAHTALAGC